MSQLDWLMFNEDHKKIWNYIRQSCSQNLWIVTANIKNMFLEEKGEFSSFICLLDDLVAKGVDVKIVYSSKLGERVASEIENAKHLDMDKNFFCCIRSHWKLIVIDEKVIYLGSANLTGAGMGFKSEEKRNFEAGIFVDNEELAMIAMKKIQALYNENYCHQCSFKNDYCKKQ